MSHPLEAIGFVFVLVVTAGFAGSYVWMFLTVIQIWNVVAPKEEEADAQRKEAAE